MTHRATVPRVFRKGVPPFPWQASIAETGEAGQSPALGSQTTPADRWSEVWGVLTGIASGGGSSQFPAYEWKQISISGGGNFSTGVGYVASPPVPAGYMQTGYIYDQGNNPTLPVDGTCIVRAFRRGTNDPSTGADEWYFIGGDATALLGDFAFRGVHVYNNAAESVATATTVTLAFDAERFDTDNFHDDVTNNSRLTVPTNLAGVYHIGFHINWHDPIVVNYTAQILLNGTTILAKSQRDNQGCHVSTIFDLNVGDYVEVQVLHDDASTLTVDSAGDYTPEFWMYKCGASLAGGGVYGQANDLPSLPGTGPRKTVDLLEAHPTIGDNFNVSMADDAGNDRLKWTFDNLGVFGRVNQGTPTYGPRRRVDLGIDNSSGISGVKNLSTTIADDPANDELYFTLNNLGQFYRVTNNGVTSATAGPRRRLNVINAQPSSGLVNITVAGLDVPGSDEVQVTFDNLGVYFRNGPSPYYGPRRGINVVGDGSTVAVAFADAPLLDEGQYTISATGAIAVARYDWNYYQNVSASNYFVFGMPYRANGATEFNNTDQISSTTLWAIPFISPRGGTVDALAFSLIANGAVPVGKKIRLGLYAATSATNLAGGALVVDAGAVVVDSVNYPATPIAVVIALGAPVTLNPTKVYFVVLRSDDYTAGTPPTLVGTNGTVTNTIKWWTPWGTSFANLRVDVGGVFQVGWRVSGMGADAALPDPFPGGATALKETDLIPVVFVRYSA